MVKPEADSHRKRLRIPNVDVSLDEVELEVVNTREFQRLFNLKQLGLAYLVYPGATHTRGVHSIETLHQATRILDALRVNGFTVSRSDYEAVRLAALLHDIGHVPFSHILEDEHVVLIRPHDGSVRLKDVFGRLRRSLKANVRSPELYAEVDFRLEAAQEILISVASKNEDDKDWKSDLVGNTICADLLAYINSDATWTGIEKKPGHYRIYEYFRIEKKKCRKTVEREGRLEEKIWAQERLCVALTKNGVLRVDIVSAILDILDIRYAITERVLFHHAKCVASAMLARAARLCNLTDADCTCLAEDDSLKDGTEKRCLIRMGDESFLEFLERRAIERKEPGALRLIRGLGSRQLYKRVFKISRKMKDAYDSEMPAVDFISIWRDPEKVEEMLCSVEDELGLHRGDLVLWCSDAKSGMKAVKVNVTWQVQGHYTEPRQLRDVSEFSTVHQRVQAIEQQYGDLWCFWVAVDKQHTHRTSDIIQAIEKRVGISCDRLFKESRLQVSEGSPSVEEAGALEKMCNEFVADFVPAMMKALSTIEAPALDGNDQVLSMAILNQLALNWVKERASAPPKAGKDALAKTPAKGTKKRKAGIVNDPPEGQKLFPDNDPAKPET
jgi:HD superfamily phosphohydrolase